MLDPKHKNIGATVSMINIIAQKEADEAAENFKGNRIGSVLAGVIGDIDELFMAESSECDWKTDKACTFNGPTPVPVPCCIGECPLGALVDEELKDTANSIDLNEVGGALSFGADPDQAIEGPGITYGAGYGWSRAGSHHHVGYTGWRKCWNMVKKNLLHGWGDWLKGYVAFIIKEWRLYTLMTFIIILIYYGSAYAGKYSVHLF